MRECSGLAAIWSARLVAQEAEGASGRLNKQSDEHGRAAERRPFYLLDAAIKQFSRQERACDFARYNESYRSRRTAGNINDR
jgi:hypothetical protein